MEEQLISTNRISPYVVPDETLKTTSLLYLQDALENERFEECAQLIQAAYEYGALRREIRNKITSYLRKQSRGRRNEAPLRVTGRKRF